MTTEHSTYTYEGGEQETVTLTRGPVTPHGHALLIIEYSDGQAVDCYVNTAWLRDRLDDLGEPRRTEPRPLTPEAITDEMVKRAAHCIAMQRMPLTYSYNPDHTAGRFYDYAREVLQVALTEPPARPEGAERFDPIVDAAIRGHSDITSPSVVRTISDAIATHLTDPTRKKA